MERRVWKSATGLAIVLTLLVSCGPPDVKPVEPVGGPGGKGQDAAQKSYKYCPLEMWGWGAEYDAKIVAIIEDPECNPSDRKDAIARAGDSRIYDAMVPLFGILESEEDTALRIEAIKALGSFGTKRTLRPYEAMLDDPDPLVSTAAAKSLAQLASWGDRYAIHLMKRLAASGDKGDLRLVGVVALGRAGKFAAVDELLALLGSDQATIRGDAAESLGYVGDLRAVEPLIALLGDEDQTVRSKVINALGTLGDPRATQPLLEVAEKDVERYVRSDAAYAVGRIADESALPKLMSLLEEADLNDQWTFQYAVGSFGTLAYDPAVKLLASEKKGLREAGVNILAQIHDTRAKPHLIAAIADESQEVRIAAARALGQMAGKDVVKALLDAYGKEKTEDVRSEILRSMGYVGDPKFEPVLIKAAKDEAVRLRAEAVRSLGSYRSDKSIDAIIDALGNENEWVREAAASTLGNMNLKKGVQPLFGLLDDDDAWVRQSVVSALGILGDQSAVPEIAKLAGDKDENVRRAVLTSMGQLGGDAAFEVLMAALDDEKEYVRETALRGLGQIVSEREVKDIGPFMVAFTKALGDKDYYVKREAAYRLAEMRFPFPEGVQDGLIGALAAADDYAMEEIVWALSQVDDPDVAARLLAIVEQSELGVDNSIDQAVASMRKDLVEARLLELAKSQDALTRATASLALAYVGSESAEDTILPQLGSDNAFTRQIAAEALGVCGTVESVGPLETILADADEDVVVAAAQSLGEIGRREQGAVSVDRLIDLLGSPNLRLSSAAAASLGTIGDPKAAPKLLELFMASATKLKSLGCGIQCSVVGQYGYALQMLGPDPVVVKALTGMLSATHPRTRSEAARVLETFAAKDIAPDLAKAAKAETDVYVRDDLILALGRTGSPKAVPVLKEILADADPFTTANVIRSLGRTGSTKEVKLVEGYLGHPNVSIRIAAVEALGRLKSASSVPKLVALLAGDQPRWMSRSVYEALVRIGDAKACEKQLEIALRDGQLKDEILVAGLSAAALRIEALRPVFENRLAAFGMGGKILDLVAYLYGDEARGAELYAWLRDLRVLRRSESVASFVMAAFFLGGDQGKSYLSELTKESYSSYVSSTARSILLDLY